MKLGDNVLETRKVPISQTSDTVAISVLMQNAVNQIASNPDKANELIGINPNLKNLLETHPSRVIKLKNLVNVADLFDDGYIDELVEDIEAQCKNYGKLIAIEIPKPVLTGNSLPIILLNRNTHCRPWICVCRV